MLTSFLMLSFIWPSLFPLLNSCVCTTEALNETPYQPLLVTDLDLIADLDHLRAKHYRIYWPVTSCTIPTRGQTQGTQLSTE